MEESTPGTSTTHGKAEAEVTRAATIACFIVDDVVLREGDKLQTHQTTQRTSALLCRGHRLANGTAEGRTVIMAKVMIFQNLQIVAQN